MTQRPAARFPLRHPLAMPAVDAYVVADREFYVSHDYKTRRPSPRPSREPSAAIRQ
jgi:hypothetical protein